MFHFATLLQKCHEKFFCLRKDSSVHPGGRFLLLTNPSDDNPSSTFLSARSTGLQEVSLSLSGEQQGRLQEEAAGAGFSPEQKQPPVSESGGDADLEPLSLTFSQQETVSLCQSELVARALDALPGPALPDALTGQASRISEEPGGYVLEKPVLDAEVCAWQEQGARPLVDALKSAGSERNRGEGFGVLQAQLWREAREYLQLLTRERGALDDDARRLAEIKAEIGATGTYWQTFAELAYGARVAWRNNTRCIGRLHWQTLAVRDLRHLSTAEEIFQALLEHIRLATNQGKIRSTISVFAPALPGCDGIRIWNPQFIRYAGYRLPDGSIKGDPLHADLTEALYALGWNGGRGTAFDILPLVIQLPGEKPRLFDLPEDLVLEVPLHHPDYPWFAELGLKWHALPVIANMRLDIGGISYTAAPFNGWYMGTEIGARNLGDMQRYNLLPTVARAMGLDTNSERSLWKDRALIELNVAVLSSFARAGVTIVDHHTASRQFLLHDVREERAGRQVPAHWTWLVPPISGSLSPIFHRKTFKNVIHKPNFFYQPDPWKHISDSDRMASLAACPLDTSASACPVSH